MSIEQTLAEAKKHGLRLNNLYQIDDATFRANWRRGEWFSNIVSGWGATAVLAESLEVALKQMPTPKDVEDYKAAKEAINAEPAGIFG